MVGNKLYGLSQADDGCWFIMICLLENHGNRWAYLLFDEAMYPYRYNGPHRFLDVSEVPDTSLWRERCRWFGEDAGMMCVCHSTVNDLIQP